MGTSSTFLVHPADDGWVTDEELSRTTPDGLLGLVGDGPCIAARAVHSDVCFVIGRAPGAAEWRWVFGEAGAHAYADSFDPSGWLDTLDPEELESSWDERLAATAPAVVAWAIAVGLETPTLTAVHEALDAGHVFVEEGVFSLLDAIGLVAPLRETTFVGTPSDRSDPSYGAPLPPVVVVPRSFPVQAIAIDRASDAWAEINAYDLEFRFGEPPCVLTWHGSRYVLSEPPVHVSGPATLPGEWVDVPAEHAADFFTAAAWARSHVGETGRSHDGTRPALLVDDPRPRATHGREPGPWDLYRRADHAQVVVSLDLDRQPAGGVAADLARSFYDRLVGATVASVGEAYSVTYGEMEADRGWGLAVSGLTMRPAGRIGGTKATSDAWQRVVAKLRTGEMTGAQCSIRRTNAWGYARESFTYLKASFSLWPDRRGLGDPSVRLEISADLPFFRNLFRPGDAEAFARSGLATLPVRRGYVHVGRWADVAEHWIDIVPTAEVEDTSGFATVETHGELTWLQRSDEPPSPVVEI